MKEHPYLEIIRTYLIGCNTVDVDLIEATFAPDVIHYFTTREPVRGAKALANHWKEYQSGNGITTWVMDHGIVEGDEAVIEFSAITDYKDGHPSTILRGAEWYKFRENKIIEIRAYYHGVPDLQISGLRNFPYKEKGYRTYDIESN